MHLLRLIAGDNPSAVSILIGLGRWVLSSFVSASIAKEDATIAMRIT